MLLSWSGGEKIINLVVLRIMLLQTLLAVSQEEQEIIDGINKEMDEIKKQQEQAKKLIDEIATKIDCKGW